MTGGNLSARGRAMAQRFVTAVGGGKAEPFPICLGTGPFGTGVARDAAFAVLDAYVEGGGNLLDTAHIYGAWAKGGEGASELTIGAWLRARGGRERLLIATKGGHPPLGTPDVGRLSRKDIAQHLGESLDRLGVAHVDLYWLHRDELSRSVGEIIESLAELVKGGRIRAYGASNWTLPRIEAANAYADEHGLPPFVASQVGWSLALHPRAGQGGGMVHADEAMRGWHAHTGLPLVAYSSQANGFFGAGNVEWAQGEFAGDAPLSKRYDTPTNRGRLLRAMAIAERKGCTANQVGLAYVMSQPFLGVPIVGTGNPEHVREALGAASLRLSPDECVELSG